MKSYLRWIIVLVMSLITALTALGQQKEKTMNEEQIVKQLQELNKLYSNGFRQVNEYDATNDNTADTLLWSPAKTETEVRRILEGLLEHRVSLSKLESKDIAYQSRVQRWNIGIDAAENQYANILSVLNQFVAQYPGITSTQKSELDKALEANLSREALMTHRFILEQKQSLDEKLSWIDQYISKFGEDEQLFLKTQRLLILYLRDVEPIEQKISFDSDSKYDAAWRSAIAPIESELSKLRPKFSESRYKQDLIGIENTILTDQISHMEVENIDVVSGEVRLKVFGILRSDATLYRVPNNRIFNSQGIRAGKYYKVTELKGGQIARIEIKDQLPNVGNWSYVWAKSGDHTTMQSTYLTFDKIRVEFYNVTPTTMRVQVTDRKDGNPVSGVTIEKKDVKDKILGTTRTNDKGYADFPYEKTSYYLSVTDARLGNEKSQYVSSLPIQPRPFSRENINYYTDRPIYRRGQTVDFGIVLYNATNDDNHTLPDKEVTIKFTAQRGAEKVEISSQVTKTNANGVAQLSVQIPEDDNLSNFILEHELGNHFIEVQDYKLSYLTIDIDSIPRGYVGEKPLIVYGKTTDLNGLPTAATILMEYDSGKKIEVYSGKDGIFKIETSPVSPYKEVSRWYWRPYEELSFTASDALGNVANYTAPIYKDSTDFPLFANDALPSFKVDKSSFIIDTSKQPYTRKLLGDLSQREVYAELIASDGSQTDLGKLPIEGEQTFSLPKLKSGVYTLRLFATDGYGKQVESVSGEIYFYSPRDRKLYGEHLIWATKLSQNEILLGSSHTLTATLLITKSDDTVEQRYINLRAGALQNLKVQGAKEIAVIATKNMEQSTERIELSSEKSESEDLKIALDLKDKYLPGSQFSETIKITDAQGRPMKSAPVFVTIFDKAIADAQPGEFWSLINRFMYHVEDLQFTSMPLYERNTVAAQGGSRDSFVKAEASADLRLASSNDEEADLYSGVIRSNFVETAYFSVLLMTDEKGEITLDFKMPDTQTKYVAKVFSFGLDQETQKVGHQKIEDFNFEVYNPLSIELSTPRFLTWDDTLRGEALIRNNSDRVLTGTFAIITNDNAQEPNATGSFTVDPSSTVTKSFVLSPTQGEEIKLQGRVVAGELSDGVERIIPLISNLTEYTVAQPISAHKQTAVSLQLPKSEIATSDMILELYLDPTQLLLSKLAQQHKSYDDIKTFELFNALHYYVTYSRLFNYLEQHPAFVEELKKATPLLQSIESKESNWMDRIADPQTLATFYAFVTDSKEMKSRLSQLENTILSHAVADGGFRYSNYFRSASPWLTAYILDALKNIQPSIQSAELKAHLPKSMDFLTQELQRSNSYYRDYLGYALLLKAYKSEIKNQSDVLKTLDKETQSEFLKHLETMLKQHQELNTSALLRYGRYSRSFNTANQQQEVQKFIQDRSGYTLSDAEKLAYQVYLSEDQANVSEEVIRFMLQLKQGTIWNNAQILDVIELMLDKVEPTRIEGGASLEIAGQSYSLTPTERITGAVSMLYPGVNQSVSIRWNGVKSDYVFGGVSYRVTEPSASATPTGEKLTIEKQIFVRQVDTQGNETFQLVTDKSPARKGDKLIVRYLLEAKQDLSLVTVADPRPAASEFGYDFQGYHISDRLWWSYSRRDTEDRIYIDYLPRGKHVLEIEAVASNSGDFTYGPAQIQSYYAPEYAGNSSGGKMTVTESSRNADASPR